MAHGCQDHARRTCTWNRSLIRSKGAVAVLAIAPAEPPAMNILQGHQVGQLGQKQRV